MPVSVHAWTCVAVHICTCTDLHVLLPARVCATRVTLRDCTPVRGCTCICTPVSAPSCSCTCACVAPHITCVGGCCLCRVWKRARGHSHGATCLHAQAWPRPQPFAHACAPPSLGHCRGVHWPCQGYGLIIARSLPGPKVLLFPSQGRFWEWEAGRKHSRVHTWLGHPLGCSGCPFGVLWVPCWDPQGSCMGHCRCWSYWGAQLGSLKHPARAPIQLRSPFGVHRVPFWDALGAQLGSLGCSFGLPRVPIMIKVPVGSPSGISGEPNHDALGTHVIKVSIWDPLGAHMGSLGNPTMIPWVPISSRCPFGVRWEPTRDH